MRLIVDLMSNGDAYSLEGLANKTGKQVATLQRQIYNLKKGVVPELVANIQKSPADGLFRLVK